MKIQSIFDFRLNISELYMIFFAMSFRYEIYFLVFSTDIYIAYLLSFESFENPYFTNVLNIRISKSFYQIDIFEFIHHPEYGCRSH
jgi:hypothetical protein